MHPSWKAGVSFTDRRTGGEPRDGLGAMPTGRRVRGHTWSHEEGAGETEQAFGERMSSSGLIDFKRTLGCMSHVKPFCGPLFLENKVSYWCVKTPLCPGLFVAR